MVYYADNFLKIIIASTLCLNIIISCLMFYNIIYYGMVLQDPLLLIVHLFWVFMSLVVLAVIAIGSARLNSQVCYHNMLLNYVYLISHCVPEYALLFVNLLKKARAVVWPLFKMLTQH